MEGHAWSTVPCKYRQKQRWCREISVVGEGRGNTGMTVHLSWEIAGEIFPRSEFEKQWEWSASMQVQQIRTRHQDCGNCRSLKLQMKYSFRKCHSRTDLIHLDSSVGRKPSLFSAKRTLFLVQTSAYVKPRECPTLQSTGKGYKLILTHSVSEIILIFV